MGFFQYDDLPMYNINLGITTKQVPTERKSTTITSLYKENARDDPANDRPISAVSRILGRVVHKQIYYLSHNKILLHAKLRFRSPCLPVY